MQLTDYHAKYYAHELTKRCPSDSVEKLAASLIDAQVDLNPHQVEAEDELAEDYEGLDELRDEWEDGEEPEPLSQEGIDAIEAEISDLEAFRDLAVSISENAKGEVLLSALKIGFEKAVSLGAARKAVIFTESRRTQAYLIGLLEKHGYAGKICLFNGSNSDPGSRAIYADWKERHADSDRVNLRESRDYLNKYETMLWDLTQYALAPYAEFYEGRHAFMLKRIPFDHVTLPLGPYEMGRDIENAHVYRIGQPVAQHILKLAGGKQLDPARLVFDYTGYPGKVSVLEPLVGQSGSLALSRLSVEALDAEDYLIFGAFTSDGAELEQELCQRLFSLPGRVEPPVCVQRTGRRMDANTRESGRI